MTPPSEFAASTRMTGLKYAPSGYRRASGLAKKYRVEIRKPGSNDWQTLLSGERTENPCSPLDVPFPQPVEVGAFRFVIESLAQRGGMKSGIWEFMLPYMEKSWSNPAEGGHGALGYRPDVKDLGEFWSRSGLFAMAAHLRGERPDMRDAMIQVMRERHPWIRNSHAYGEPGGALGLLALNLVSPEGFAEIITQYAWWFSLAWEPGYGLRFTTPHTGAPYMGEDDLINAAYALVLQGPRRSLHLTGKPQ